MPAICSLPAPTGMIGAAARVGISMTILAAGVRIAACSRCRAIHVVDCRIAYPSPWTGWK
jgi:hypothetical protein